MTDKQIVEIILPLTIFEIMLAVLMGLFLYDGLTFLLRKLLESISKGKI
ncbi:hypothetical protein AN214_03356 [Pseudoalteromonas sp. P1-9]|nr:hypothetical protein AN214_03356 [Pseudoalteromonas sp. P1-9]